VQDLRTIRRLLVIGQDDYALEAIEEAAAPFGLLVRRVGGGASVEAALTGFGPDAVILDTELGDGPGVESLPGIRAAGAALLLLGTPDDHRARAVRERAEALGLELAGMLAKPLLSEGLEVALRAMAGEQAYTAADIAGRGHARRNHGLVPAATAPGHRHRVEGRTARKPSPAGSTRSTASYCRTPSCRWRRRRARSPRSPIACCRCSVAATGRMASGQGMPLRAGVNLVPVAGERSRIFPSASRGW
jgi:DNA-binding NarL/FixJ family response regulator